jgi:hypothetical protein
MYSDKKIELDILKSPVFEQAEKMLNFLGLTHELTSSII